jgi:hypothetical protein
MEVDFDRAIARLPQWIIALGLLGTGAAGYLRGWAGAGGFLVGAGAAYFNFRIIERAVNRIARLAAADSRKPRARTGVWLLIQFGIFVAGALVILRFSGFNRVAAFWGFLVCPAAALLEILYEFLTYGHS